MDEDEKFSVGAEPWLKQGGFRADPAERRAAGGDAPPDELEAIRDSVHSEPMYGTADGAPDAFADWFRRGGAASSRAGSLAMTVLAGLLAGPFAIIGALMSGQQTAVGLLYIVVFGPVTEELLKQSGMIYLLERRPYRFFSPWQFALGAVISAAVFASFENLIYRHVYLSALPPDRLLVVSAFRWTVCTALHLGCSLVASMGLVRVWRRVQDTQRPADLSAGYPCFLAAMVIHGVYKLFAALLGPLWLR